MVVEGFLSYLTSEKHYSLHTIKAYKTDLSQFQVFFAGDSIDDGLVKADHRAIRAWLASRVDQGDSARSVRRKLTCLRRFYNYLYVQQLVAQNPCDKVVSPKLPKRLPDFIDNTSIRRLFDEVDFDEGFPGFRNRMVVEILFGTGMRVAELIALKESDIDFFDSQLRVTGKRNKQRLIPLGPYLAGLIKDYSTLKRKEVPKLEEDFLIVTNKGRKAYPLLIYRIVRQSLSKVTTKSRCSPHVLRHTFATVLLENGADLNSIKELLGHANLAATQVYTHNTVGRLKKIYQQAHPKA